MNDDVNGTMSNAVSSFCQTLMRIDLVIIFLASFIGALCTSIGIGIVPDTISDRYARLHHNYTGPDCGMVGAHGDVPLECQEGTDDAQLAATWSHVGICVFGLILNPVVGSWSDRHGRKGAMIASLLVGWLSAIVFFGTIVTPTMDPFWYYLSYSLVGGFQPLGLTFAALTDLVPEMHRTGCFGVLIAVGYGAYAMGPSIPLFMDHKQTALCCAVLATANVLLAALFLPETLPHHVREANQQGPPCNVVEGRRPSESVLTRLLGPIFEPVRDISILNENWATRLYAVGAVISSMVFASDQTLLIFYIEDHFAVGDQDIASMFLAIGISGLLLQASIQSLVKITGEHNLLIGTFVCGSLHNLLYGMAKCKQTIFVALIVSQITKLNFPILPSLASKQVPETMQGRIQGALSACMAIGSAAGPVSMEFVYHHTKNKTRYGPGFMFVYAAGLYLFGTAVVTMVPRTTHETEQDSGSPAQQREGSQDNDVDCDPEDVSFRESLLVEESTSTMDLEEPLLPQATSDTDQ